MMCWSVCASPQCLLEPWSQLPSEDPTAQHPLREHIAQGCSVGASLGGMTGVYTPSPFTQLLPQCGELVLAVAGSR